MKIKLNTLIKILLTLAILLFLLWKTEFSIEGFVATIRRVQPGYYLLSFLGVVVVLGMKSYRWKLLVDNEDATFSPGKAFGAYMSSDAIGIVTPGRIGEIARLYYLRQEAPISFYQAFKTIVSDRLFDFTMLFWFGISGMLFYFKVLGNFSAIFYTLIVLAAILLGYLVAIKSLAYLMRFERLNRIPALGFVYHSFLGVVKQRAIPMWAITILAYLMYFSFSWLIMYALGLKITVIDVVFIMSLMSLSTILPVSIAGFGTREASLVLLFAYYGLPGETAISFSLLHFTAFFLWGGILGLVFWLLMPISLERVKEDTKSIFLLFKPEPGKINPEA